MDSFFISTATVTLAEIGDKTQLLSLFLVAHFRKRAPIIWAILAATLLNHGITAYFGALIGDVLGGPVFNYIISASFIGLGLWLLVPDKDDEPASSFDQYGVFIASFILFFIAEIGDKTQFATALLASEFKDVFMVTAGSSLGMLLANVPVVIAGQSLLNQIPFSKIRILAAVFSIGVGIYTLL